ncbi:MoaD family protein [Candidatus Bathyarchaeota archaeon]|nr:MoaD family protein [Candidatus Bathyarchaeota archaeon]
MRVKVKYFTMLREAAQRPYEEFELKDDATLADLIETIALKYGCEARRYLYSDENRGTIDPSIYFLINGRNSKTLEGFKTFLKDGDAAAIIPPIASHFPHPSW